MPFLKKYLECSRYLKKSGVLRIKTNAEEENKPMCARVAAMTTVAHNTSKQLSVNTKVNFSLLLPYA
jgi:hypothetical protein